MHVKYCMDSELLWKMMNEDLELKWDVYNSEKDLELKGDEIWTQQWERF